MLRRWSALGGRSAPVNQTASKWGSTQNECSDCPNAAHFLDMNPISFLSRAPNEVRMVAPMAAPARELNINGSSGYVLFYGSYSGHIAW